MDAGYHWDEWYFKWVVTSFGRIVAMYDDREDAEAHFESMKERLGWYGDTDTERDENTDGYTTIK